MTDLQSNMDWHVLLTTFYGLHVGSGGCPRPLPSIHNNGMQEYSPNSPKPLMAPTVWRFRHTYRPLSIVSTHIKLGFPARDRSKCEMRNYLTYPTAVAGESGGRRTVSDGDGGRAPDVGVTDERPRRVRVVAAHNDSINGDRLHPRPRRRRNRPATEHCNTVTIRSSAGVHDTCVTANSLLRLYAASVQRQTGEKPALNIF